MSAETTNFDFYGPEQTQGSQLEVVSANSLAKQALREVAIGEPVQSELAPAVPERTDDNVIELRRTIASYYELPIDVTAVAPPLPITEIVPHLTADSEKRETEPVFKVRSATIKDIDAIVDVDMKSFAAVYKDYDDDEATMRSNLAETFKGRLEKVGGAWMPVLERDGDIVGFMTCCPTSKSPDEFTSWEDTTDNGTLETTYDPNGKNVYVVTLSVLPNGSGGKDMLMANQMGKMMREGYEQGFFESRMPGLRGWVTRQMKHEGRSVDDLTPEERDTYANTYFNLTSLLKGETVRRDPLLRLYERVGCACLKMVPDAYIDEPSMNYGVVCTFDGNNLFDKSVLPFKVPDNRVTRWMMGMLMQGASKSQRLTNMIFE